MEEMTADGRVFDVRDLMLVRAIADRGSITAAANALGMSQPAVSQQLHRLEHRVGLPLVERVGRGVRLTEAGRIMSRHAPAVTTALDAATEELDDLRGLRTGRVRLMGFPSASPTLLPLVLAHLRENQPGVSVTYVEAEPPEAVAAVREGTADVALTFSYPGDSADPHRSTAQGLSVRTVGRDDLVLVLPAGHRALEGEPGRSGGGPLEASGTSADGTGNASEEADPHAHARAGTRAHARARADARTDNHAQSQVQAQAQAQAQAHLIRPRAVAVADLSDESWIAGCPRCRGHLLELCARAGFTPRIAFETDNVVAVEALVAQGIGVATLPRLAIASFPLLSGVVTAPLPAAEARTLHLVTAHGSETMPSVRSVFSALKHAIATLEEHGDRNVGILPTIPEEHS
ncbi:LysR family transcriptional regulator [Actinomyces provencensis]|uniref:LysR family transcriptional regulator n=1 Tax=Actinomyces provencensis TaxID=1720198 RepID=UPI001E50C700|nr:LysR family transcriptional regulator [Actinomyces provencensis]